MTVAQIPTTRLRSIGAGAAVLAAVVYLFIGLGVLSIGTAASGEAPDLVSFGLTMAVVFVVVAAVLLRFRSRTVTFAVAGVQVLVIVGYFAMSSIRNPPVELWGLLIKGLQVVVLVAAALLLARRTREPVR
jgi:hypothetical protein